MVTKMQNMSDLKDNKLFGSTLNALEATEYLNRGGQNMIDI